MLDVYRAAQAERGLAADLSRISVARALYVGTDDEPAWGAADPAYGVFRETVTRLTAPPDAPAPNRNPFDTDFMRETALFGGSAHCTNMLDRLAEMGVESVILFVSLGGLSHQQIIESLGRFHDDVMPRFPVRPLAARTNEDGRETERAGDGEDAV